MKKILILVAVFSMIFFFVGCNGKDTSEAVSTEEKEVVADSASKVVEGDAKYNDMSMDELYELAKQEGGKISIYSITSSTKNVVEEFKKIFPELEVEAYGLKTSEIIEKVPTEYNANNVVADVLITSDTTGDVYFSWYDSGYAEAYYPGKIADQIDSKFLEYGMPLYTVFDFWYYNRDIYPDGSPLKNWWDMFDKDENGEYKYSMLIKDINADTVFLALFSQLVLQADDMAKAYEEKFGEPIEYTYDPNIVPVEPENAGYEFLYRFAQAKVVLIPSHNDRLKATATSTADNPMFGNTTGSKMVKAADYGWNVGWSLDMKPFPVMMRPTNIYVAGGSDNPAGARLFIYYALGGDDPNVNNEGLLATLRYGCWALRQDYDDQVTDVALSDINYVLPDIEGIYDTYLDLSDFWVYWSDHFR